MTAQSFTRWIQGRHRERIDARLRQYQPVYAKPLRTAARCMLVAISMMLSACLLAMCAPSTVHAQSINQSVPQQANRYRADLVRAAHSQWGLDAPIAAMAAQVHQESGWNPSAISPVGARGLTQFMPATATWWCGLQKLPAAQCQPSNPVWALRSMAGYDKWLYDRTPAHYSHYDRLWVALRAYNGGLGHWNAEAAVARRLHQQLPTRQQADAACGTARRAALHCAESLGYPRRILVALQPRYANWGRVLP
jgi:soluble lytic murein transglycosylase-like protein